MTATNPIPPVPPPAVDLSAGTPGHSNQLCFSPAMVWSAIATAAIAAVSAFGFGLSEGNRQGRVEAASEVATTKNVLAKVESDLKIQTDHAESARETIKQYKDYAASLSSTIATDTQQLQQLASQLQQTSGCRFAQVQVASLEQQMKSLYDSKRFPNLFGSSSAAEEAQRQQKLDAEIKQMQERTLALTQQLGACPK